MRLINAIRNPAHTLERIRYYGVGPLVLDQVKVYPRLLPSAFKSLRLAKRAANLTGYLHRKRVAAKISKISEFKNLFPAKSGYRICPPGTFEAVDRIIPVARAVYKDFLGLYPSGRMGPAIYSKLLFDYKRADGDHSRTDLRAHPEFQKLAENRAFIEMASGYLGEVPILGTIDLQVIVPNDDTQGFQKFHIDGGGYAGRQMKIFIAVEDVDEDNGATFVMDASVSRKLAKKIGYRHGRIADEIIMAEPWRQHVVSASGPAGTTFLYDTCRAIHAGGRTRTRPRVVIILQYISKYTAAGTALQRNEFDFDREQAASDPVTKLLFDL